MWLRSDGATLWLRYNLIVRLELCVGYSVDSNMLAEKPARLFLDSDGVGQRPERIGELQQKRLPLLPIAGGPAPWPHAVTSGAVGARAAPLMASTNSPISALLAT